MRKEVCNKEVKGLGFGGGRPCTSVNLIDFMSDKTGGI